MRIRHKYYSSIVEIIASWKISISFGRGHQCFNIFGLHQFYDFVGPSGLLCSVRLFVFFISFVFVFKKKTKQKGVGRRECVSTSKIRVVNQRTNAWRPAINAPCSVTSGVYIIYNSTSSLQMLTKNIGRTEDTHTHTQKGGGFDSWTTIYYTITARTAQTL